MRGCFKRHNPGECTCPEILTTGTEGQPVVTCVDGFVHLRIGVHEWVLSTALAEEAGIALVGNAGLARKGFD